VQEAGDKTERAEDEVKEGGDGAESWRWMLVVWREEGREEGMRRIGRTAFYPDGERREEEGEEGEEDVCACRHSLL
jgi:hypothetical protein